VEPVAATDQERERNGQQHDADAADQDPDGVVEQVAATGAEAASERDETVAGSVHPVPVRCVFHQSPS
jgi:hypothetical protein